MGALICNQDNGMARICKAFLIRNTSDMKTGTALCSKLSTYPPPSLLIYQ
jgi:hypothetical protein